MTDYSELLATITPSATRRRVGFTVLCLLGGFSLYLAFNMTGNVVGQLVLLAFGGGVLVLAEKLRRATLLTIELTADEIRDTSGRVLARVDNIKSLDRGVFAFKPSNGFMLVLKSGNGSAWAPGLWWRIGRMVGIGGVTRDAQSKIMSEILANLLAQRDGPK
ncbi:hypothetical protein [Pseudogemmobacter sp. W21_MBD1_M6]|jgi:hypothetical protein|uniref:hypothetical protein n=1 Tax=Pseudogemmobacter sp. W21_MBD1_M6 TaxID=3240271 RepID=UPI003F9698FF